MNMRKRSLLGEESIHVRKRSKQGDGVLEQNKYGDGVAWCRGAMIGKGSFGCVFLGNLKKPKSKYSSYPPIMAVKSAEVSVSGSIQKEREVLNNIRGCPYVISCFGDEITNGENGQMVYNLLLEYGSGGTLADLIRKSGGNGLPEFDVRLYTRSVLRGICHIHRCGYVHCDLKPDNILLVGNSRGGGFKAKIGDLGLAKRAKQSKKSNLAPYWRGTPMYLSPEAVNDGVQEPPCDIWAIGCIVLEMLTGKPPWDSNLDSDAEVTLRRIGEENESPCIPSTVSMEGRNFLKSCFSRKVMFRMTAEMLLDHPFLEGLDEDEDDDNNAVEELGEIIDINAISSSLEFPETDEEEELSFSSFSDGSSYISEEEPSYWSDRDADNTDDEVDSCFSEDGSLQAEEKADITLNEANQYPVTLTISTGV